MKKIIILLSLLILVGCNVTGNIVLSVENDSDVNKVWKKHKDYWGPPYCNEGSRLGGPNLCSSVNGVNIEGQDCSQYKTGQTVKTAYNSQNNYICTEEPKEVVETIVEEEPESNEEEVETIIEEEPESNEEEVEENVDINNAKLEVDLEENSENSEEETNNTDPEESDNISETIKKEITEKIIKSLEEEIDTTYITSEIKNTITQKVNEFIVDGSDVTEVSDIIKNDILIIINQAIDEQNIEIIEYNETIENNESIDSEFNYTINDEDTQDDLENNETIDQDAEFGSDEENYDEIEYDEESDFSNEQDYLEDEGEYFGEDDDQSYEEGNIEGESFDCYDENGEVKSTEECSEVAEEGQTECFDEQNEFIECSEFIQNDNSEENLEDEIIDENHNEEINLQPEESIIEEAVELFTQEAPKPKPKTVIRKKGRVIVEVDGTSNLEGDVFTNSKKDKFGTTLIKDMNLPEGSTKTVFVDKIQRKSDTICLKDKPVKKINDMTKNCNGADEFLLLCDGINRKGYSCIDNGKSFKITGLKHSLVREFKEPSNSWLYFGIGVGVIFLIIGGILFKRVNKVKKLRNLKEHELEEHALNECKNNINPEQIRADLSMTEHNNSLIDLAITNAQIKYYIMSARFHNTPEENIKISLINQGWDQKKVNQLLSSTPVS